MACLILPRFGHKAGRLAVQLAFVLALVMALAAGRAAWAAPLSSPVGSLNEDVEEALAHLKAGDLPGALAACRALDETWRQVQGQIRESDLRGYQELEGAVSGVRAAASAEPVHPEQLQAALLHLEQLDEGLLAAAAQPGQLQDVLRSIRMAESEARAGDVQEAASALALVRQQWPQVEMEVKARSPAVYRAVEEGLGLASTQLAANPPDLANAAAALERVEGLLTPLAQAEVHYGPWDAAFILVREGLEALLVVAALLAFLRKSGHGDKAGWVWLGGAGGVALSVGVAVAVQNLFHHAAAQVGREVLEGATSLLAAVLLLYMSWWLHSKARLAAWRQFIERQGSRALARGSLFSLAFLALLAVFREGAETILFFVGIAPAIGLRELVLGLALGGAGLVALGIAMLALGMRLPVRPFFLLASGLVYYLAFKFVGTGVHALQVAGLLPATPSRWLPTVDGLGLFPTWQSALPQLAMLLAAAAAVLWPALRPRPTHR